MQITACCKPPQQNEAIQILNHRVGLWRIFNFCCNGIGPGSFGRATEVLQKEREGGRKTGREGGKEGGRERKEWKGKKERKISIQGLANPYTKREMWGPATMS